MESAEESERLPLIRGGRQRSSPSTSITILCLVIFTVGCLAVTAAISLSYEQTDDGGSDHPNTTTRGPGPAPTSGSSTFSVLSLMVWGSPGSFGVLDKELRMAALGDLIAADTEHDIFLLNDLWMRADHATIRKSLPEGYLITAVGDLSPASCDGVAAPEFCSGLAVVSRHKILQLEFTGFTDHGDLFWDYEYFLRRGVANLRLEPSPGLSVDVILTSLATLNYNTWYRTSQTAQLIQLINHSDADHLIMAGDFNVDPRDKEDTYKTVTTTMVDAFEEFYKNDPAKLTDPNFATLGNPQNTYTDKDQQPVVYDYIFYKNKGVSLNDYKVLNLKTKKEELSLSDHQALSATFTLNK